MKKKQQQQNMIMKFQMKKGRKATVKKRAQSTQPGRWKGDTIMCAAGGCGCRARRGGRRFGGGGGWGEFVSGGGVVVVGLGMEWGLGGGGKG